MKLAKIIAFAAAASVRCDESINVPDMLAKEGKDDDKVSEENHCWCKSLKESFATRGREQEFRLKHLERRKTMTNLDNQKLRREISEHHDQIQKHEESLESTPKESDDQDEKQKFHKKAIKSVQDARAELPTDSAKEVRSTLDDLEELHVKKLKDAKDDKSNEQLKKLDALRESKARMLRLENEAADTKGSQLESGEAVDEVASSQIAAYEKQQEADAALSEAIDGLCSTLGAESTERTRLRQQALIATSQKAVSKAHGAWNKKASKLTLAEVAAGKLLEQVKTFDALRESKAPRLTPSVAAAGHTFHAVRRLRGQDKEGCDEASLELAEGQARNAEQALEDASQASNELKSLLGRTDQLRGDLGRFLNSVVLSMHMYESVASGAFRSALQTGHQPVAAMDLQPNPLGPESSPDEPVDLEEAMAELSREVKNNLEVDSPLFDGLKKLRLQQMTADKDLMQVLHSAKAETSSAVAALNC